MQVSVTHILKRINDFFVSEASLRLLTWLTGESAALLIARVATREQCRRPLDWMIGRLLGITTTRCFCVSRHIIRRNSNSIIIITPIIISSSIPISQSRTVWMLFIIDWMRGPPSSNRNNNRSSNIRRRWSISSRTSSAKSFRPATRDLAPTAKTTTTTTTSKTVISIIIIVIIKRRGILRKDTSTSNAESDCRRRAWRFLTIGTGSWSENVGSWQRAASPYLKIER